MVGFLVRISLDGVNNKATFNRHTVVAIGIEHNTLFTLDKDDFFYEVDLRGCLTVAE